MMDRIAVAVEADPGYAARLHFTETLPDATTADALSLAARDIADTISASAIICFTFSGSSARRIARDRPSVPMLVLTPKLSTARRMGLLWGAHAVRTRDVASFEEMVARAKRIALRNKLADAGDRIVIIAGVPFGTPGSTNMLHVQRLTGKELDGYEG
jgi:pyruvate kinase